MKLEDLILTDEELDSAQEECNSYLAQPGRSLQLLVRLAGGAAPPQAGLVALERLAEERLASLAARAGAPILPDAMQELRGAIRDLLSFPGLANRTVVGIGGAFSAGKSRFLNSLCGASLLPEDLGPCTVIPTYLGHGAGEAVALGASGNLVPMDPDALAALSHAFSRHHRFEEAGAGLSQLIKLLMVTHDVRNGGLRADDIRFLRAVGQGEAVFFVLTQADLVAQSAIGPLLDAVRGTAERAGIRCAGVMAWGAPPGAAAAGRRGGNDIRLWLDRIDDQVRHPGLGRRCMHLVDRGLRHCRRALGQQEAMLAALNELQVLAGAPTAGRYPELDAELRRLRRVQGERHDVLAKLDACRNALAEAVSNLLGPLVDDEPPGGPGLLLDCARAGFAAATPAGRLCVLRVVGARPDLKHVRAVFLEGGELRIPFSRIRQCWGIDLLALDSRSELAARLFDATDERLSFSVYHYNNHTASQ